MRKFDLIKTDDGTSYLVHQPGSDSILEPYVQTWLQSSRNRYFMRWTLYDSGYKYELYSDVSNAVPLSKFLEECRRPGELQAVIVQVCQALISLQEAILEPERLDLDAEAIWIFAQRVRKGRKTEFVVRLSYLPFRSNSAKGDSMSSAQAVPSTIFLTLLCEKLISLYGKKLKSEKANLLLHAASQGETALLSHLSSNLLKKAKPRTERRRSTKPRRITKLQFPMLLLGVQLFLLAGIYFIDRLLGAVPLSILILMTGMLLLICIWEAILLLHSASPYCVRLGDKENQLSNPKKAIAVDRDPPNENIQLHPLAESRTAILTLLSGSVQGQTDMSWQILNDEFLIGSDPERCNLLLSEHGAETDVVLRICQRAGIFYAQSLSSTQSVWLQSRMLYRYEDYQLPEECQIRIGQVMLRFRIY